MHYCSNCGNELKEGADVCLSCGKVLRQTQSNQQDTGSAGWGVLGFFFPLVGLILYIIWKSDQPRNAKSAGKGALIGIIASFVMGILYSILIASVLDNPYYYFLNFIM